MPNQRIFLSYSHDEAPFVRSVAAGLARRGLDAGLNHEEPNVGEPFVDRIQEALRSSSVLVAFFGRALDSPWLNFEIGAALGASKTVLPVFLTTSAREAAPPPVREFSGIDASNLKPDEVAEEISEYLAAAA
jgi:TIR domain